MVAMETYRRDLSIDSPLDFSTLPVAKKISLEIRPREGTIYVNAQRSAYTSLLLNDYCTAHRSAYTALLASDTPSCRGARRQSRTSYPETLRVD